MLGERGDLLSVPKGTTHWFDMGTQPDFTAIRFFRDQEGWVGEFTGDPIAERIPDFDTIVAAREPSTDAATPERRPERPLAASTTGRGPIHT